MTVAFWFRRDRRLIDNEALTLAVREAKTQGTELFCFYVKQEQEIRPAEFEPSPLRLASLDSSLGALDEQLGGRLGLAETWTQAVTSLHGAGVQKVFAMRTFDPAGVYAEERMSVLLAERGISLELHGSGYAVSPGTVCKDDGTPLRIYTPFFRRWAQVDPRPSLPKPDFVPAKTAFPSPASSIDGGGLFVEAGESAAVHTANRFFKHRIQNYADSRNRADLGGTSHLSHALSHGEIHPRTLLQLIPKGQGGEVFQKELAWREFYADVLFHNPQSLWGYLDKRFELMRYDQGELAEQRFLAWQLGETGYPIVDAGMRQLRTTGWMHNRVRMITASFLVKDLHMEWTRGAAWFESQLTDFDPASNAHGWQWTAGCGTDASPYFRVFNPVLQGLKFDPNGDYVRKYIPELEHLQGKDVHQPWLVHDGLSRGYQAPIVDHAVERLESLRRLEEFQQRIDGNRNEDKS